MTFRSASSHAECSSCIKYKALIAGLGHHLRARKAQQLMYYEHLKAQFDDRVQYWRARGLSRQRSLDICIILDGMDQGKFGLPRCNALRSKSFEGFSRPRMHVVGLICHGHFTMLSIAEADIRKDSNQSIELIAHALQRLRDNGVDVSNSRLHIQADNTSREVKNGMVLRWLCGQVSASLLSSAECNFLRSGHSHEDIDQMFGSLACYLRRVRHCETSQDLVQHCQAFLDKLDRKFEPQKFAVKLDGTRDWCWRRIWKVFD